MELDDFGTAWQTLDRRLREQNEVGFQLLKHQRLDAMRRGLRPLAVGQAIGMLVGALAMVWLLPMWTAPAPTHDPWVKVCGAVLHGYCIGLIVLGGIVQGLIARVDYAEPVLAIQQRLLRLRRIYLVGGRLLGLPWWFLSAPLLVVADARRDPRHGAVGDLGPAGGRRRGPRRDLALPPLGATGRPVPTSAAASTTAPPVAACAAHRPHSTIWRASSGNDAARATRPRRPRHEGGYQTFTRCAGSRCSFWPGFTSNAAYQASRLRTVSAR